MKQLSDQFIKPIVEYLAKEGIKYQGMFYAGLILAKEGPNLLEINVRFGDPETQAIIPLLQTDLLELLHASASGSLSDITDIHWKDKTAMTVVMASKGYPENFQKLTPIKNLQNLKLSDQEYVYHAGTKFINNEWLSNGGRVLNITCIGSDLLTIRKNIHRVIKQIEWDQGYYRKDIGWRYLSE